LQIAYAALVAFLYQPQLTLFGRNFTPEEALLAGNLFSFLVSPGRKLRAAISARREIGAGITSLAFPKPSGFSFVPGQYMEWSIPLRNSDSRGNRRYFSLASSPTEPELLIAARIPVGASRYKQELMRMPEGAMVTAGELGGDFVLPRNPRVPLAFIAGGIGITPFRSMIRFLLDTGGKRDIVLLYSNYTEQEIVFGDVLKEAACRMGLKVVHTLTDPARVRPGWCGRTGFIDAHMIRQEVPDCRARHFMVSGSPGMVNAVTSALRSAGVPRRRVRTDYFPGYSM
jgi:ferredoxin-NADP reductase